jgi:hypothetical protein
MPGLAPGIHVFGSSHCWAWMTGSSPVMTIMEIGQNGLNPIAAIFTAPPEQF